MIVFTYNQIYADIIMFVLGFGLGWVFGPGDKQ